MDENKRDGAIALNEERVNTTRPQAEDDKGSASAIKLSKILVIDDPQGGPCELTRSLCSLGYRCELLPSLESLDAYADDGDTQVALLFVKWSPSLEIPSRLERLRFGKFTTASIVVFSDQMDPNMLRTFLSRGISDVLVGPRSEEKLRDLVDRAILNSVNWQKRMEEIRELWPVASSLCESHVGVVATQSYWKSESPNLTSVAYETCSEFSGWNQGRVANSQICHAQRGWKREVLEARAQQMSFQWNLTTREREVLLPLIRGKTYGEMADEMGVTRRTIKFHVANIYRKSNVGHRAELIQSFYGNN